MDARVKEIADRLEALVAAKDPMSDFVLTFFRKHGRFPADSSEIDRPMVCEVAWAHNRLQSA